MVVHVDVSLETPMDVIASSAARTRLAATVDRVCGVHEATTITRQAVRTRQWPEKGRLRLSG